MPLLEELLRVKCLRKIYLIDNTEADIRREQMAKENATLGEQFATNKIRFMAMPEDLGYGKAHNIALRESASYKTSFPLVITSDIPVNAAEIDYMQDWM